MKRSMGGQRSDPAGVGHREALSVRASRVGLSGVWLVTAACWIGSAAASGASEKTGTWQGTPPGTKALPPRSFVGSNRWLVHSTDRSAHGRGALGKNLMDVCFWNDRRGFAVGAMGVYRTDDGGLTWQAVTVEPKRGWQAVAMAGRDDIWIGGHKHPGGAGLGFLRHSTDGGRTWTDVLADKVYAVSCIRTTPMGGVWVLTGHRDSFYRRNERAKWLRINFPKGFRAYDVCFPGDVPYARRYCAYAVGSLSGKPAVLRSSDSGRTWQALRVGGEVSELRRVWFVTSRQGWIGGGDALLYTNDAGRTWQRRTIPAPGQSLTDLLFYRTGCGWAAYNQPFDGIGKLVFEHTLFYTRDGGRTWTPELSGYKSVHGLWSNGPGTCWVVGNTPGFVPNDLVAILDTCDTTAGGW